MKLFIILFLLTNTFAADEFCELDSIVLIFDDDESPTNLSEEIQGLRENKDLMIFLGKTKNKTICPTPEQFSEEKIAEIKVRISSEHASWGDLFENLLKENIRNKTCFSFADFLLHAGKRPPTNTIQTLDLIRELRSPQDIKAYHLKINRKTLLTDLLYYFINGEISLNEMEDFLSFYSHLYFDEGIHTVQINPDLSRPPTSRWGMIMAIGDYEAVQRAGKDERRLIKAFGDMKFVDKKFQDISYFYPMSFVRTKFRNVHPRGHLGSYDDGDTGIYLFEELPRRSSRLITLPTFLGPSEVKKEFQFVDMFSAHGDRVGPSEIINHDYFHTIGDNDEWNPIRIQFWNFAQLELQKNAFKPKVLEKAKEYINAYVGDVWPIHVKKKEDLLKQDWGFFSFYHQRTDYDKSMDEETRVDLKKFMEIIVRKIISQ